jgi:hypothetical protein
MAVRNTAVAKSALVGHRSWMSPNAMKDDLLYISDNGYAEVFIYSYPALQLVGQIQNFGNTPPQGECVDRAGDVFVTVPGQYQIWEYAHGGTSPIAVLDDSDASGGYYATGCSVNKKNGTLAVTNASCECNQGAAVAIFKHHKSGYSSPIFYRDPNFAIYMYCGYDPNGNLFVDGFNASYVFRFAELPKGSTSFTDITLNQTINYSGNVQWDGTYIAVGDQGAGKYPNQSAIYQFTISGSSGTEVGVTPLGNSGDVVQFWKQGTKVIGPNTQYSDVPIWNYPAGGTPVTVISGGLGSPVGVVVSKASSL